MKQYKYVITLLVTWQLLFTTGCSDWLHLVPEDGVSIREYWKTKEDVRSAMNGIYASMLADGTVKGIFLYGEGRADVIGEYNRTNARMLKIIEGELEADNAELDWSTFYTTINLCNTLVEYAPLAFENDNTFTQKELDQYVAQAITVRTLMYFYLVRAYGDIPFSLEPYVDSSRPFVLAKTNKDQIMKDLISHLEALNQTGNEKLPFPDAKADPAQNKGRVNVYTLKALLADLYLWNEQYEECVRQCDQILNSNMYSLIPVGREMKGGRDEEGEDEEEEIEEEPVYYVANESDANNLFLSLYVNGNSVESIFELQFSLEKTNPLWTYTNRSNGWLIGKSETFSNYLFPVSEINTDFKDIRESISLFSSQYIWKYVGLERGVNNPRTQQTMEGNFIIYRLAEVYLMKAEALTQLGIQNENREQLEEALAVLQVIRTRANATETTDLIGEDEEFKGEILEQFILWERAREFTFEGKRWFDVLRHAKRNDYANLNYLIELAGRSAPADKVRSLQTKYQNINSHYFPLPQSEVESNALLEQNEFYAK